MMREALPTARLMRRIDEIATAERPRRVIGQHISETARRANECRLLRLGYPGSVQTSVGISP
jgi:hypothetical protein